MCCEIPEYLVKIICCCRCEVLVPASCYVQNGKPVIQWDTGGLVSLDRLLENIDLKFNNYGLIYEHENGYFMNSGVVVLRLLRFIAESFLKAEDWLMGQDRISLELKDIYWDPDKRIIKLMAGPQKKCESAGFTFAELCRKIHEECSYGNADLLYEKLKEEAEERNLGLKALVRLLYSWEMKLSA